MSERETATELVKRLEAGETGREIDAEIARQYPRQHYPVPFRIKDATDPRLEDRYDDGWRMGESEADRWPMNLPEYTTSLDAAVALVERVRPGCVYDLTTLYAPRARVYDPTDPVAQGFTGWSEAPTPAAALIAALLKAKGAGDE